MTAPSERCARCDETFRFSWGPRTHPEPDPIYKASHPQLRLWRLLRWLFGFHAFVPPPADKEGT